MYNKIKLLFIIVIILITLNYVYADEEFTYCNAVNVCPGINPGNYEVRCKTISDSFCPENYSRNYWLDPANCPPSSYGRCAPCDPDCGPCGYVEHYVQPTAEPCSTIQNFVIVRVSASSVKAWPVYSNENGGNLIRGVSCSTPPCYVNYQHSLRTYELEQNGVAECFGGDSYSYYANAPPGASQPRVLGIGYTRPNLTLYLHPSTSPVSGSPRVVANATSRIGVTRLNVYATKWSPTFNEFRRICIAPGCSANDYCSFRLNCGESDPNKCSYFIDETITTMDPPQIINRDATFDTTRCENNNYTIYGYVEDTRNSNTRSINFLTSNENAPCTDECPIFTSKTLNTIISKIKTWLNP